MKKLSSYMRNMGIDTYYQSEINHKVMEEVAFTQNRVILTRDKKFFSKENNKAPCYIFID